MAGASSAAAKSGLFSMFRSGRVQSEGFQAMAMWGVAAGTGALWVVQPFNWIKKTFIDKPAEPEGQ